MSNEVDSAPAPSGTDDPHHRHYRALGLMAIDVSDYYKPGDAVWIDRDVDGPTVSLVIDADGRRTDVCLNVDQARALAAGLDHFATEAER